MRESFLLLASMVFSISNTFAQIPNQATIQKQHLSLIDIESSAPLTLSIALERALNANPELAVAAHEVNALKGAVHQADTWRNPEIVALLEDTRQTTRTTTLQLNQPFELGGKRQVRIEAAERSLDTAKIELKAKHADIRATVITAFYDTLVAQEYFNLAQALVELAQRVTIIVFKRVTAGKISPIEETKARIAESTMRVELVQAKSELARARQRLAATWGGTTPRFDHVDGQIGILPSLSSLDELMQRLQNAPMLMRAKLEIEQRQALAQIERSQQIPDLIVSLGVKRSKEVGYNQALLGISIPIPLFNRNQGNVHEALSRIEKARDGYRATEIQLHNELIQIYERLTVAYHETQSLQQDILPGAQSAYNAVTQGFELGKFSFLDVLDAQRTLFQAKSQYLRTVSAVYRATAEIERIIGAVESAKL